MASSPRARAALRVVASADSLCDRACDPEGPEVPFPMSEQVPFPWISVEGVWSACDGDARSIYGFEIKASPEGQRSLLIQQVDILTGAILAEGVGQLGINESVSAVMRGERTAPYVVVIRAYLDASALKVVLTKRPLTKPDRGGKHYVLERARPAR